MARRSFILVGILLLVFPVFAQEGIKVSAGNYLRYGTGEERIGKSITRKKEYLENLTDTRISLNEFIIGFRLLYDSPPEYGYEFTGVRKRFVEFRRDDLIVRAGDSYTLYGRGLALNLFEQRALAYDTGLDGITMTYVNEMVKFGATAGTIQYHDLLTPSRIEEYRLRAGSAEITPVEGFTAGVTFVHGNARFPGTLAGQSDATFDMPEFFGRVRLGDLDVFGSYAEKRTFTFRDADSHRGSGFYATAAFTGTGFGTSLEYKDYRFGIVDPYERLNPNRAARALAFQNPPTGFKEHTFALLSRYPHVIDFSDETGFQLDMFATPADRLTANLNLACASRHYAFRPTGDTNATTSLPVYGSPARDNSFLPNFGHEYSPFWEIYAELQYFLREGANDYILFGFNRRSDEQTDELQYTAGVGPKVAAVRSTGIPALAEITITDPWVVRLDVEIQWVHDEKNIVEADYRNQFISLTLSRAPEYSVTFRHEWTNDRGTADGRVSWTALDAAYRLGASHTITLTIGNDRGGQICSNGVCRTVNPFSGVRCSLLSYF